MKPVAILEFKKWRGHCGVKAKVEGWATEMSILQGDLSLF